MFHSNPRTRTMVALFAAMVLLAAACGASDDNGDEGGIASISEGTEDGGDGSSSSDAQGTAEAPADAEDAFALYDACMAKAGFEFQTIEPGTGDGLDLAPLEPAEADPQAGGSADDLGGEGFDEANTACGVHLVNIDAGFDLSPEQETAIADADLKWTQCMRDQGIDLPDPQPSGGVAVESGDAGGDDPQGPSAEADQDFDFDAFTDAAEACDSVFEELNELFEDGSDQEGGSDQ